MGMKAVDFLLSRPRDRAELSANVSLIAGLTDRIQRLETRVAEQDQNLAQEIKLRLQTQEQNSRLRIRVMNLESQLRRLGAVIPEYEDEH